MKDSLVIFYFILGPFYQASLSCRGVIGKPEAFRKGGGQAALCSKPKLLICAKPSRLISLENDR